MFDKEEHNKTVNLYGDKSLNIEENKGPVSVSIYQNIPILQTNDILEKFNRASIDLKSYNNTFQDKNKVHIERKETDTLYNWINTDLKEKEFSIALLVGNAGYGKSVILRDLLDKLNRGNIATLAIKVDRLQNIETIKDLEIELKLEGGIVEYFEELKKTNTCVVFLIDQIDAISQSLTSNRSAIDSFNRLILQYAQDQQVKIIISCRTFDLEYDPTLRSYKDQTIVRVSPLELTDVERVLQENNIEVDENKKQLKEFLRVPLHLKLFCKVGLTASFENNITLQDLYNEIWKEYITTSTNQEINTQDLVQLLYSIATKMTEQQKLVVDKRHFEPQNSKALSYLLHHDLLQEQGQNKIQFIHQTFFDYAYARSFVSQGKSISEWLKDIHQGLFIRSQVKQLFAYFRDLDTYTYIDELRTVLLDDKYRFHLKYMLVYDITFYESPLPEEKQLFFDLINKDKLYFTLFVEAIQRIKWFKFIIKADDLKNLVFENTTEANNLLIALCRRIVWQETEVVIKFLETITDSNAEVVKSVLQSISGDNILMAKDLYLKVYSNLQENFYEYHILSEFIKKDIDFAIERMKLLFDEHLSNRSDKVYDNNYIPGGHEGLHLYENLYKENPNKAIAYFLYVIEQISKSKFYETDKQLFIEFSFTYYRPNVSSIKEDYYEYTDLYDTILACIYKKDILNQNSTILILNTLDSRHPNLLAIGVFYLLTNIDTELDRVFKLFTQDYFFKEIRASEILRYYSLELLRKAHPLFTEHQQRVVNEYLLATKDILLHLMIGVFSEKKRLPSYLYNTHKLLSALSEQDINKYPELKKVYQEGYRKYGLQENEEPQIISVRMGSPAYGSFAYEKMTLDDWYRSFLKLETDRSLSSWDKPSKEGNVEQFKEYVSKDTLFYFDFINGLVDNPEISIEYVFAGMEGLQKAKFDIDKVQGLCLKVLEFREKELTERKLYPLLRIIEHIVPNNANIDRKVFDFIRKLVYETKDRELDETRNSIGDGIELTAINLGINSIRGIAVGILTYCYLLEEYKDEIFESLEYVADTANEVTRSCAIYKAAWLNNLDLDRAFDLYLRLTKDYSPYLLAIPFDDGHPLLYFINSHFKKLIPFFKKAIEIKEAGVSMSHFLLNAYINDKEDALPLLKKCLSNNTNAQCKILNSISRYVLNTKNAEKGWEIVVYLLDFESEELANSFDLCFWNLEPVFTRKLIFFLDRFVASPQCNYPQENLYNFLGKLIDADVYKSKQCLEWFFASKPEMVEKEIFYKGSPLDVLFAGYNGIRDYNKKEPILEQVLDIFDDLLKLPNYRNFHMSKTFKALES